MTTNEEQVRRVMEAQQSPETSAAVLDEVFAPNFICHGQPGVNHTHARGSENCFLVGLASAFERLEMRQTGLESDGDRVVVHVTGEGDQVAEFMGRPPAGPCRFLGVIIFRFADTRVVEGWATLNWNRL